MPVGGPIHISEIINFNKYIEVYEPRFNSESLNSLIRRFINKDELDDDELEYVTEEIRRSSEILENNLEIRIEIEKYR
jgi:hypothetical protein